MSKFQNVLRTIPEKIFTGFYTLRSTKRSQTWFQKLLSLPLIQFNPFNLHYLFRSVGLVFCASKLIPWQLNQPFGRKLVIFFYCNLVIEKKCFDKKVFDLINTEYSITKKFLIDFLGYKSVSHISKRLAGVTKNI